MIMTEFNWVFTTMPYPFFHKDVINEWIFMSTTHHNNLINRGKKHNLLSWGKSGIWITLFTKGFHRNMVRFPCNIKHQPALEQTLETSFNWVLGMCIGYFSPHKSIKLHTLFPIALAMGVESHALLNIPRLHLSMELEAPPIGNSGSRSESSCSHVA